MDGSAAEPHRPNHSPLVQPGSSRYRWPRPPRPHVSDEFHCHTARAVNLNRALALAVRTELSFMTTSPL